MRNGTKTLRSKISAPEILVLPGVFDGYSARLVTAAGYQGGFLTGAGVSEARLGQPDVGLAGLAENVAAARDITACVPLPILADADTGYGNAVNVVHTTAAFETAGVAGMMLEDQQWPKRCGHMRGKSVIDAEEATEKVRAAVETRSDEEFVIMARTDAYATHGLAEVVDRLNRYADVGADLVFADAITTAEDIATIAARVRAPLCVNMGFGLRERGTTPLLSAKQLEDMGVSTVIYPRMLTAAALQGMRHALDLLGQSLRTGEVVQAPEALFSFDELNDVMGLGRIADLEQRYAC